MKRYRRPVILLAAAGVLAAVDGARADAAPAARLVYVRGPGAEQCPAEPAVRAAVSARLGYDPFLDGARDMLLVEIQRGPRAFRVAVKLVDGDARQRGAREIAVRGEACAAAIDALALSISLALDARTAGRPPPPPSPPPPSLTPAAAPPAIVRAAPPPAEVGVGPAAALALRAGAGALGALGAAPSATAGGTLFVGARWRALSLDVEGRVDVPATGDSDVPPVAVRSWLVAGALVPCLHVGAVFGCAVAAAGRLGATARNVPVMLERHGPWSAAGLRAGVEWAVHPRVVLQAYAQALATLTRDTLLVDATLVYRVPAWSPALGAAAAFRFR